MGMAGTALSLVGALFLVGAAGASLTLGVAVVCRLMKWSPINITVNVYKPDGED